MSLSANTPRTYDAPNSLKKLLPIYQSTTIYEGAALGEVSSGGYIRGLVAGDVFWGFADRGEVNSGASGAKNALAILKGQIQLAVVGVTGVANVGETVYASDDGTFTLTSTSNTAIGKIIRHISSTTCVVAFEAAAVRSI